MMIPDEQRVVAEAQRLLDEGVMITRTGAAVEVLEADGGRAPQAMIEAVVRQLETRLA